MDKEFWEAAATRAARTFAQAVLGAVGTGAIGVAQVDWLGALSIGATAAIVSLLTSVATGLPEAGDSRGRHARGGEGR